MKPTVQAKTVRRRTPYISRAPSGKTEPLKSMPVKRAVPREKGFMEIVPVKHSVPADERPMEVVPVTGKERVVEFMSVKRMMESMEPMPMQQFVRPKMMTVERFGVVNN
jgi:hypothetical protein